ncbi:MAG: hypothetical protein MJ097_02680 [Dorea sp.]|nr:hypothetical protein [Dorea sp.]
MKRQISSKDRQAIRRIGVWMSECAVHVTDDQILKDYMGYDLEKALVLAKYIKRNYKREYGKPLYITTMSLAVELIGHFWMQEMALKIKGSLGRGRSLPNPLIRICDRILLSTEVIDCGERHCDNNRFVWDILAVPATIFHRERGDPDPIYGSRE